MDRLINWTEVEEWMHRQHETTEQWSMRIAIENYVDAMPEAVVRCKDCEFYNGEYRDCDIDILAKPNGYCSYGERRDDEQTI